MTSRFPTIVALMAITTFHSQAQELQGIWPSWTLDANVGRYFFNPSSYQKLVFDTKSQWVYGVKASLPTSSTLSLFFAVSYVGFTESHAQKSIRFISGGLPPGIYLIETSVQSSYKEALSLLGLSGHYFISNYTAISPYFAVAVPYIHEQDGRAEVSYEFVALGAALGAEIELYNNRTPLSAFLRMEANYEHRGPESLLRRHSFRNDPCG